MNKLCIWTINMFCRLNHNKHNYIWKKNADIACHNITALIWVGWLTRLCFDMLQWWRQSPDWYCGIICHPLEFDKTALVETSYKELTKLLLSYFIYFFLHDCLNGKNSLATAKWNMKHMADGYTGKNLPS